ncbi:MAG: hypothetical protein M3680_26250, partial [Myxococcota bacterium]|nr:hypothetical protein [Myxococcota bacterium]
MMQSSTRRALVLSAVLHLAAGGLGWLTLDGRDARRTELVDIELAPPPPEVEALPAEVARPPEEDLTARADESAASTPPGPG